MSIFEGAIGAITTVGIPGLAFIGLTLQGLKSIASTLILMILIAMMTIYRQ